MSTFPNFWIQAKLVLSQLVRESAIQNSFRLIFDCSCLNKQDIPLKFLKSDSVIFQLTEQNIEDMDGLNDIWA